MNKSNLLISINTRILSKAITGVQRYLLELVQRMPGGGTWQMGSPRHNNGEKCRESRL